MKNNLLLLTCFTVFVQINAREVTSFNEGWSFTFNETRTLSAGSSMLSRSGSEPVTIPHTWNADDYLSNEEFKCCLGI